MKLALLYEKLAAFLIYSIMNLDAEMTAGRMNIPTIGYSGMQRELAHTSKEMVSVEMLMRSLEGYFSIICELFAIYKNVSEDSIKISQ